MNILRGGAGGDTLDGGTGTDLVTYFGTTAAVTVNLQTGVGSGGEAQGDSISASRMSTAVRPETQSPAMVAPISYAATKATTSSVVGPEETPSTAVPAPISSPISAPTSR